MGSEMCIRDRCWVCLVRWFNGLSSLRTMDQLVYELGQQEGRVAAVSTLRAEDERGGGPAPPVRTSQAPPPGTPPQGSSTGDLSNAVENFASEETDATYDKVFTSRWAKRKSDAQAAAPAAASRLIPQRQQLGA